MREACGWVRDKFGIELDAASHAFAGRRSLQAAGAQKAARRPTTSRETEYAVLNALDVYFTTQDGQGQKRVDREQAGGLGPRPV